MSTTTTTTTAAQHKTALGRLIQWLGSTIKSLFNSTGKAFNSLPPDQQKGAIDGTQISQIIKTGYSKGEAWVLGEITAKTGIPADVATQVILTIAKDSNINVTSVQAYLDHIAKTVQAGITDNHWNSIWQTAAQFGATYLTQGKLDWVSLGLGIIEYAFQVFVNKAKPHTSPAIAEGDPVSPPTGPKP